MDKFNSVFIDTVNYQADTAFQSNGLAVFWKAVQLFDDIASDGIIIFGSQFCADGFIDIIQFGRAKSKIFSSWLNFFDIFSFVSIVFIADLTYDFFQKIFQSDKSCGGTVSSTIARFTDALRISIIRSAVDLCS